MEKIKKAGLSVIFLLIISTLYATETKLIEIEEGYHIKSTFSGNLENGKTFQSLIFQKGYSTFKIRTFVNDLKTDFTELESISFKKTPSIESFHLQGEKLFLLVNEGQNNKRVLTPVVYNLSTKKNKVLKTIDMKNFQKSIRLHDKTLLLFNKKNAVTIVIFNDSHQKHDYTIENAKMLFFENTPTYINQLEYVKNGSNKKENIYYDDNQLVLIKNDAKKIVYSILDLNETNQTIKPKEIYFETKYKDYNSFYSDGKIVLVGLNSEKSDVMIYDSKTNQLVKKYKIEDLITSNKKVQDFIKNAKKTRFKPTIVFNKTKKNNYEVTIDYVDNNTYQYYDNWWFFRHSMMHQQMMNNIHRGGGSFGVPGIGPSPHYHIPFLDEENHEMTFYFNSNFEIIENGGALSYKFIDRDVYLKKYEENKKIKFLSSSFSKNYYTICYYSKKNKKVILKEIPLLQ